MPLAIWVGLNLPVAESMEVYKSLFPRVCKQMMIIVPKIVSLGKLWNTYFDTEYWDKIKWEYHTQKQICIYPSFLL